MQKVKTFRHLHQYSHFSESKIIEKYKERDLEIQEFIQGKKILFFSTAFEHVRCITTTIIYEEE